jgi:hypothetical protein
MTTVQHIPAVYYILVITFVCALSVLTRTPKIPHLQPNHQTIRFGLGSGAAFFESDHLRPGHLNAVHVQ